MVKELVILFAAIFGSLSTLIGVIISNRYQMKNQLLRMKKEWEEECNKYSRTKLEEAHIILSKISAENSLTMSCIIASSDMSLKEYHERYNENHDKLNNLGMIIDLYFPRLSYEVEEMTGLTNIFWGHQQMLLQKPKRDESTQISIAKKILENSEKINEKVVSIKTQMISFSDSIQRFYEQEDDL